MAQRRSRSSLSDVDLNLTSFLDLIFNILAFFVITFNPPSPERNYDLSLPPPKAPKNAQEVELPTGDGPVAKLFDDVTITLTSAPGGALGAIVIGQKNVGANTQALVRELQATAKTIGESFEAANIASDPKLNYGALIEVVDACYRANIKKINFVKAAAPANP